MTTASIEVRGPKQPGSHPPGHRHKPAGRFLLEHPLNQVELFGGMALLQSARRDAKRQLIEGEEAVSRASHGQS
jgi:hypothetical protein